MTSTTQKDDRTILDASDKEREIGIRIGRAIARDVIADAMPREWTGLDPQDADQIPADCRPEVVAVIARRSYLSRLAKTD
jgi:hypothetical protein